MPTCLGEGEEQSLHTPLEEHHKSISNEDAAIISELQQLLVGTMNGEAIDMATPIAAAVDDKGLIVDFQDHGNIIPIHAEFEDPLVPSDYDAYGGGALNW